MWKKNVKEVLKWVGFLILNTLLWTTMLLVIYYTRSKLPFLIGFIGVFPLLEEWFKSNHSNTQFKAHLFGVLEYLIVAYFICFTMKGLTSAQQVSIMIAKTMSIMMHFATGRLYLTMGKNQVFWGCVGLHMLFNTIIYCAKIQNFEIVLFAPFALLYVATYYFKKLF